MAGAANSSCVGVRERLLDVSERLISERGYAGTSVADIVAAAGVGAPTLYWHFANKRGVLRALIDRSAERWRASLPAPTAPRAGTPRERFLASLKISSQWFVDEPRFLRLTLLVALERSSDDNELLLDVRAGRDHARDWIAAVMLASWPALPSASAKALAMKIIAVFDGVAVQQCLRPRSSPLNMHAWIHGVVADEAEAIVAALRKKPRRKN